MGDEDVNVVITVPPIPGSSKSSKTLIGITGSGRLVQYDSWKAMNRSEPEDESSGEDDTPEAIGISPTLLDAARRELDLTNSGDEEDEECVLQENGLPVRGNHPSGHPEATTETNKDTVHIPERSAPPVNETLDRPRRAVIRKMKTVRRKEEEEQDQPPVRRSSRKRNLHKRVRFDDSDDDSEEDEDEEGSPQQTRRGKTLLRKPQSSNKPKKAKASPENQKRSTSSRPLGKKSVTEICDLVWAKLLNYPWWPALVCGDPERSEHHKLDDYGRIKKVHVQFLGYPRTCDWITNDSKSLAPFTGPDPPKLFKKLIEQNQKEVYDAAVKEAVEALQIPEDERHQLIERVGEDEGEVQQPADTSHHEPDDDGSADLVEVTPAKEDDKDWTPESPSPKRKKKEVEHMKHIRKIIIPARGKEGSPKVPQAKRRASSPSKENVTQKKQKTAVSSTQKPGGVVRCSACSIVSGVQFSNWQTNYGVLLCPRCWTFLDQEISDWKKNAGNSDKQKKCPKGSSLATRGLRCDMRKVSEARCEACRLCAILGAVTSMPFNLFTGLAARLPNNRIPSSVPPHTTQWTSDVKTLLEQCDESSFGALPHFTRFLTPAQSNDASEEAGTSPGPPEAVVSEAEMPGPSEAVASEAAMPGPSSSVAVISSNGPSATSLPANPQRAPRRRTRTKGPVKAEQARFSGLDHPFVYIFKDDLLRKFLLWMDPVAFRRCLTTIGEALKERKKRLNLDCLSGPVVCPVCLHVFNVQPGGVRPAQFGGAHMCSTCQNFMEAETRAAIMNVEEAERGDGASPFPQYYCVSNGACKFKEGEDKRCNSCWLLHGINALKAVPHSFEAFRSLLFRLPSVSNPSSLPEGVRSKPQEGQEKKHFAELIEPIVSPVKECGVCGVECAGEDWRIWCGLKVCTCCKTFFSNVEDSGRRNAEVLRSRGAGAFEYSLLVKYSCVGGSSVSRVDRCLLKSPPDDRCMACWIRAGLENARTISFTLFRGLAACLPDTHRPRKQCSTRFGLRRSAGSETNHFSLMLFDRMPEFKDKELFGPGVMEEKPQVATRLANRRMAKRLFFPIRIPLDGLVRPKLELCEVCSKPGSANSEAEKRLYCRLCHRCAASFVALVPGASRFSCTETHSVQDCPMNPDASGGRCSGCWLKKILDSSRDMDFHVFLQLARHLPKARLPKILDIANFDMDTFLVECTPMATGRTELSRLEVIKKVISCTKTAVQDSGVRLDGSHLVGNGPSVQHVVVKNKPSVVGSNSSSSATAGDGVEGERCVLKTYQTQQIDDHECFEVPNPSEPEVQVIHESLGGRFPGTLRRTRLINKGMSDSSAQSTSDVSVVTVTSSPAGSSSGSRQSSLQVTSMLQSSGRQLAAMPLMVNGSQLITSGLISASQLTPAQRQMIVAQMVARQQAGPSGQSPSGSSVGRFIVNGQVGLRGSNGQATGLWTTGGVPTATTTGQVVLQQHGWAPTSNVQQSIRNREIRPKPPANTTRGNGTLRQPPALLPLTRTAGPSAGLRIVRLAPLQSQMPAKGSVVRHGQVLATQLFYIHDVSGIDWRDYDGEKARELLQQPLESEEERKVATAFNGVINFFKSPEFLEGSQ